MEKHAGSCQVALNFVIKLFIRDLLYFLGVNFTFAIFLYQKLLRKLGFSCSSSHINCYTKNSPNFFRDKKSLRINTLFYIIYLNFNSNSLSRAHIPVFSCASMYIVYIIIYFFILLFCP